MAAATLGALLGCHGDKTGGALAPRETAVVPFGPGLGLLQPAGPVRAGASAQLHAIWSANVPAPAMRLQWRPRDPQVLAVDSLSGDTRTAFVRGLAPGRTVVDVVDLAHGQALAVAVAVE